MRELILKREKCTILYGGEALCPRYGIGSASYGWKVGLMKRKDLIRKLEAVGYSKDRTGDHTIYEKKGSPPVQVPNHREINEYTARAILKTAGIAK